MIKTNVSKSLQAIEAANAIYGRRAVRRYTAEPMPRESIEELIEAAIQAPSPTNDQPWAFVVLAGAQRLRKYSDRAKDFALQLIDGPYPHPMKLLEPDVNIFHGAPCVVVICATTSGTQAEQDCCLAGENFMLAAFANGFGTCPIGLSRPWLSLPATKLELAIPMEWTLVLPIAIGWPDESPQAPGRKPAQIIWA